MNKRILAFCMLIFFFLTSCADSDAPPPDASLKEVVFVMDTIVSLDIRDHASEKLVKTMTDRLTAIDRLMSLRKEGSDIYRVNHSNGEMTDIDASTYYVLEKALEYSQMTEGSFDPSIGRLVTLWSIGTDDARLPSNNEIATAKMTVGIENIVLGRNHSMKLIGDTMVDLGAIAKGFAADEMIRIAKEDGVKSAIFNLGGNVSVLGSKDSGPFRVGIRNPFSETDDFFGIVEVIDTSVVTSGNYERFFIDEEGNRYHHILDPSTGYPADSELAGVSVICPSSIKADAFSTALYVMGLEEGIAFVERREDMEAIFVTNTRNVYVSTGLRSAFVLTDDSFRMIE